MKYYHNLVTEKNFQILQNLREKYRFILIGGWAIFLYTRALKSKDIDIIVDYEQLEKLKNEFSVFKNERLKRYEIKIEEVDIDIYLPFYSQIGLPVEEIKKYTQSREGFIVPWPEILLILKTYVFKQREASAKGRKDLLDIFSLLKSDLINWQRYWEIIKKYNLKLLNDDLKDLINSAKSLAELNLNEQSMTRLKRKILSEIPYLFTHQHQNRDKGFERCQLVEVDTNKALWKLLKNRFGGGLPHNERKAFYYLGGCE